MDQLAKFEQTESKLSEELKEFEKKVKDLLEKNQKVEDEKRDLEDKIEQLEADGKNGGGYNTRNSIGSDGDDYSSVQEMKDHLKHARQILI